MMKKIYTKIILVATLTLSLVACRKESPNIMSPGDVTPFTGMESDPSVIFNDFWNAMNTSYLFWDIDPTDWDAIYTEYAPKFEELDEIYWEESNDDYIEIDNYADAGATKIEVLPSSIKAMEYYKEMTANIIDQHYYFILKGVGLSLPSYEQIKSRDYYHESSATEPTLIWNALTNQSNISNVKRAHYYNDFVIYSAEIDGIAILSISGFSIQETINDSSLSLIPELSNATVDEVLYNYFDIIDSENFKGAIFDLRNNGGGDTADLTLLFSDYVNKDEKIPFMKARQKNGPGRLDYSPYTDISLAGNSNDPTDSFPIVSLFNLYSASMSEVGSLFFKEFNDDSIWIGERSAGANGPIIDDIILGGGQISNDYISIYMASMMSSDMNEVCHEGIGLTPDIELLYNDVIDDLEAGNDLVMNKAIEYLNSL